ncbi:MAG TPA: NAD-dependent succinate-semialdehyde dehydrogenase [Gemmatimonadaceae bacterium]|nr:NAD-dependent succinate-semialdehyde dehydrogenase [Gemmatimonadaceae bacterium]
MPIATINPASGQTLETFESLTRKQIDRKLELASTAWRAHRHTTFEQRAKWMRRAADLLESESHSLGHLMTLEMGKPIIAAVAEVAKCATVCRYYANHAARFLADKSAPAADGHARIVFQPMGVVLAIMPWNFPFWQVFRFAAPALMAGNCGLLKHSSNVPQCALAIEDVFLRAGFPEGVFQTLLIGSSEIESIIEDSRVAAVTITGSEGAGRSVAATAGRSLKKTVLELGGSDPFIVMPSANIEAAVSTAVKARMINNGQSCIAAKRFIVHRSVYDDFIEKFVAGVKAVKVGDPMHESTELGPLATSSIRDEIDDQVQKTISAGARALCGGKRIDGPGFYYEPTVLIDIPEGSPADDEELFGPVASVWSAHDIDDAIRIANSTRFGLGSSVWTSDYDEMARFVADIEAGMVFINGMVASEVTLPFGGVKNSGYGRELGNIGIREFVNIKAIKLVTALATHAKTK